jgi:hypothetical protein
MALPISTWALVAGLAASGLTILLSRAVLPTDWPPAVLWLGAWGTLFALQAGWWALFRRRAE